MTQFSRHTKADYAPAQQVAPLAAAPSVAAPHDLAAFGTPHGADGARRNPIQAIWNRRWIVVFTLLLSVAAAVVHLLRATPIYQATARLTVERNGPRIVANDPSDIAGQQQNYLNTQCEVLRSRKILSTVADDPAVAQMETFRGNADQVITYLKTNTIAQVGRKDDIINLYVRSPVPRDAAVLANAIVEAYKADLGTQKKSSVKQVVEFYEREKHNTEKALNEARNNKLNFQRDNAELALGSERVSPALERVARLSSALTDVQLEELNTNAAFEATKSIAGDPQRIRRLLDSRQFKSENADLRREMRELQQRFATVGRTYLPNFPDVGVLQNAIKQLDTELQAEEKKVFEAYVAELESRLTTLRNNEAQLQTFLNEAKSSAIAQNNSAAELAIYEAQGQSLERYDKDLAMRIRELSPLSAEAMVNVDKIEEAREKEARLAIVEPNRANVMYLALFGGGLLGAMLAFVRDTLDQRLRGAEEIKQVLNLPILGVIPHILGPATAQHRGLQLHADPMGDVAESYRTVRTSLYFGTPAGTAKTVLITSPAPSEGKSTLASNLAIAMAQAGNRIVLLDADFRKPTQHKIFNIQRNVGLSNVLAGQQPLEEALFETEVPGLDVLPCGPIPANPSEILNSQTFADVLAELVERYDHVLLDSPPVMPVTDARILAANCDATVLAVRAEKTARRAAIYTRDVLRSVGARLLGVVVNDVPRRKSVYGYYYSDAHVYAYGYGKRTTGPAATRTSTSNGGTGETKGSNGSNGSHGNGTSGNGASAKGASPKSASPKSAAATTASVAKPHS